jgi:hypothetical protein
VSPTSLARHPIQGCRDDGEARQQLIRGTGNNVAATAVSVKTAIRCVLQNRVAEPSSDVTVLRLGNARFRDGIGRCFPYRSMARFGKVSVDRFRWGGDILL